MMDEQRDLASRMDAAEESVRSALQGAGIGSDGWRDSQSLLPALEKLRQLSQRNPQLAMELWERVIPGDPDPPAFLDSRGRGGTIGPTREAEHLAASPGQAPADKELAHTEQEQDGAFFGAALRKRFLQVDNRYFSREAGNPLAFEDHASRIRAWREDALTISGMLELARSKGWTALDVSGSAHFQRSVWLRATEQGLQVAGYQPTELDRIALQDRLSEQHRGADHRTGVPRNEHARDRHGYANSGQAREDSPLALTAAERARIEQLREILERDGASSATIARVMSAARERFENQRFYAGVLIEQGVTNYRNDPGNERSPYAVLETPVGRRTIWGVDLPRAIEEAGIQRGQTVSFEYKGSRTVEIKVPSHNAAGEVDGHELRAVRRNTWEVRPLSKLSEVDRVESLRKAQTTARSELTGTRRDVQPGRALPASRSAAVRDPIHRPEPERVHS